jgi:hypothetical protein
MSIQSISSSYQTQMSSVRSDFQDFSKNAKALQGVLISGNQDQVTISENALSVSLAQITNDFSNKAPAQSSSGSSGQAQNPMQAFQNDLQTLQSALSSTSGSQTNSGQDTSSSNTPVGTALNNVLNDLSTMQSHGHHHHHHGSGGISSASSASSSTQSQDPMQTLLSDLQNLKGTLTAGTQSQNATTALNNVLNDISKFTQGHSGSANSTAINISA